MTIKNVYSTSLYILLQMKMRGFQELEMLLILGKFVLFHHGILMSEKIILLNVSLSRIKLSGTTGWLCDSQCNTKNIAISTFQFQLNLNCLKKNLNLNLMRLYFSLLQPLPSSG